MARRRASMAQQEAPSAGRLQRKKSMANAAPRDFQGNDYELSQRDLEQYFAHSSAKANPTELLKLLEEAAFAELERLWGSRQLSCAQFLDLLCPILSKATAAQASLPSQSDALARDSLPALMVGSPSRPESSSRAPPPAVAVSPFTSGEQPELLAFSMLGGMSLRAGDKAQQQLGHSTCEGRRRRESHATIAAFLDRGEGTEAAAGLAASPSIAPPAVRVPLSPLCGSTPTTALPHARGNSGSTEVPAASGFFDKSVMMASSVSFSQSQQQLSICATLTSSPQRRLASSASGAFFSSDDDMRHYLRSAFALIDRSRLGKLGWDAFSSFIASGISKELGEKLMGSGAGPAGDTKQRQQSNRVIANRLGGDLVDGDDAIDGASTIDRNPSALENGDPTTQTGTQRRLECIVKYTFAGEVAVPKLNIGTVSREWFHTFQCIPEVIGGKTVLLASQATVSFFSVGTWRGTPPPSATIELALLQKQEQEAEQRRSTLGSSYTENASAGGSTSPGANASSRQGGGGGEGSGGTGAKRRFTDAQHEGQQLAMKLSLEGHVIRHDPNHKSIVAATFMGDPYNCVVTSTPHYLCPFVVWQFSIYSRRPPVAIVDGRLYPSSMCDATATALLWVRLEDREEKARHGGYLWIGTRKGTIVRIHTSIDVATSVGDPTVVFGKPVVVASHRDFVTGFLHLPLRDSVVSASLDATVKVMDRNLSVTVLRAHSRGVLALHYSDRLSTLFTAGHDGTIVAWAENYWSNFAYRLEDNSHEKLPIVAVKAIPSTHIVASFDCAGTLKLFDSINQALIRCISVADPVHVALGLVKPEQLRSSTHTGASASGSGGGPGGGGGAKAPGKKKTSTMGTHSMGAPPSGGVKHYFACMDLSGGTDRDILIAGSRVYRFSLSDKALLNPKRAHNLTDPIVAALRLQQHGFATASAREVSFWSLRNGMKRVNYQHFATNSRIASVTAHFASNVVLVGNDDGVIVAYQASTGAVVLLLECHDQPVSSLTLDPVHPVMVSTCRGAESSIVAVWEDPALFSPTASGEPAFSKPSMGAGAHHPSSPAGGALPAAPMDAVAEVLRILPRQVLPLAECALFSSFDPTGNILAVATQTQLLFFIKHRVFHRLVRASRLEVGAMSEIQSIVWLPQSDPTGEAKHYTHPAQNSYRIVACDNRGRISLWEIDADFERFTAEHSLIFFWMNRSIIDEFAARKVAEVENLQKALQHYPSTQQQLIDDAAQQQQQQHAKQKKSSVAGGTTPADGNNGNDDGDGEAHFVTEDEIMDLALDDAVSRRKHRIKRIAARFGAVIHQTSPEQLMAEQMAALEQEAVRRERLRLEELALIVAGDPVARAEYSVLLAQMEATQAAAAAGGAPAAVGPPSGGASPTSVGRQARLRRFSQHGICSMHELKQQSLVASAQSLQATDPQLVGAMEAFQTKRAQQLHERHQRRSQKSTTTSSGGDRLYDLEQRMLSSSVRAIALDPLYPYLLYTGDESSKITVWYLATEDPHLDRSPLAALEAVRLKLLGRRVAHDDADREALFTVRALLCWLEEPQALHSFAPFLAAGDDAGAALSVAISGVVAVSEPFHCLLVSGSDNRVVITTWNGVQLGALEQGPILHRNWRLKSRLADYHRQASFSVTLLWMKLRRFVLGGLFMEAAALHRKARAAKQTAASGGGAADDDDPAAAGASAFDAEPLLHMPLKLRSSFTYLRTLTEHRPAQKVPSGGSTTTTATAAAAAASRLVSFAGEATALSAYMNPFGRPTFLPDADELLADDVDSVDSGEEDGTTTSGVDPPAPAGGGTATPVAAVTAHQSFVSSASGSSAYSSFRGGGRPRRGEPHRAKLPRALMPLDVPRLRQPCRRGNGTLSPPPPSASTPPLSSAAAAADETRPLPRRAKDPQQLPRRAKSVEPLAKPLPAQHLAGPAEAVSFQGGGALALVPQSRTLRDDRTLLEQLALPPPAHSPTNISILRRDELRECLHIPKPRQVTTSEFLRQPHDPLGQLVDPTVLSAVMVAGGLFPTRSTILKQIAPAAASSAQDAPRVAFTAQPLPLISPRRMLRSAEQPPAPGSAATEHEAGAGEKEKVPVPKHAPKHPQVKYHLDDAAADNAEEYAEEAEESDRDVRETRRTFDEPPLVAHRRALLFGGQRPKLQAHSIVRPLPDAEVDRRVVFTGKAQVSQRPDVPLARKRALLLL